jgi:hypothetical protein
MLPRGVLANFVAFGAREEDLVVRYQSLDGKLFRKPNRGRISGRTGVIKKNDERAPIVLRASSAPIPQQNYSRSTIGAS